ncbi:MAG: radical SAM protein [Myxococcales bacterium]|nr:radical SAM protein [Myxococcales bacterium]
MAYLDRAVIALSSKSLPRFETFVSELLRPAELHPGSRLGRVTVGNWEHSGDHAHMSWSYDGEPRTALITLRPRDEADGAYLRTPRWNVGYLGEGFDDVLQALLREVAHRVESVCAAREWSAEELHERWFRRPTSDEYLEITPGKKLYLRVTDYCDENCVFCNATEGNANIVDSKMALRQILAGLPAGGLSQVIFSGGEPTLVRALPDYVALAAEAGAREIILQTNGVGLAAPGELERYLPWRDRVGIGFSLHAADVGLSDLLTGIAHVPSLPLAERFRRGLDVDAIELEKSAKSSVQASPPATQPSRYDAKITAIDRAVALGFRVKITCVVVKPNLAQVPAFTRWCWERWGERLDRMQFSYAMPRGNAWLNPRWSLKFSDCIAPFAEAFEIGRETGMWVETSQTSCVPPCVMPDYLDHYDLYGDHGGGGTADAERIKPPEVCTGCNFDRVCAGVWRRYIDTFGTDELKAVTHLPEPDVVIDDFTDSQVFDLGEDA